MPLTPNNRNEAWMKGMVDGSTDLTPNNRKEHWYSEIIDAIGSGGGGGGGGGAFIVHASGSPETLDKTWQEIANAMTTSVIVHAIENSGETSFAYCTSVGDDLEGGNEHYVSFMSASGQEVFYICATAADYPIIEE